MTTCPFCGKLFSCFDDRPEDICPDCLADNDLDNSDLDFEDY